MKTYFRVSCLNGRAPAPGEAVQRMDFVFDDRTCEKHLPEMMRRVFSLAPKSSDGGKAILVQQGRDVGAPACGECEAETGGASPKVV